jgi:two-component system nitrogen regulation response regulator GlnG
LKQAVAAGHFRDDLFYRLHGVRIHMPPLRDREGDIPLLIKYVLSKVAREQQRQPKSIVSNAVKVLEKYHWPGNVRELESVLRHVMVVSQGDVILLKDLPAEISGETSSAMPVVPVTSGVGEGGTSDIAALARQLFQWARRDPKLKIIPVIERELVIQAMKESNGNQVHAARILGITRATLRKRLEKFGIQRELSIK